MVNGGQRRCVDTPCGAVSYTLIKKRVKNLNLRLDRSGEVVLSVPVGYAAANADRFVADKSCWIVEKQTLLRENRVQPGEEMSRGECLKRLKQALDEVYPLVQPLGVDYPQLRLRKMKSQWGNCHWAQGYITLNTALARCPEPLRRYVALHELVHFLHHDHGPGFYACMDHLMPQWREHRAQLKKYSGIAAL